MRIEFLVLAHLCRRSAHKRYRRLLGQSPFSAIEDNVLLGVIDTAMELTETHVLTKDIMLAVLADTMPNAPQYGPMIDKIMQPLEGEDALTEHLVTRYLARQGIRKLSAEAIMDLEANTMPDVHDMERSIMEVRRLVDTGVTKEMTSYAMMDADYLGVYHKPLPTGFGPEVDQYAVGPGEIGLIMGSTGIGKTTFLVNIARHNAMHGRTVVYLTLEEPRYKIHRRLDQSIMEMQHDAMDFATSEKAKDKLHAARGTFHLLDGSSRRTDVPLLDSWLERLQEEGWTPDLVVVDYADKFKSEGSVGRNVQDMDEAYDDLSRLASKYVCPVWTATQVQRSAYGFDKIGLDNASWSMAKTESASAVLAINRNAETDKNGIVHAKVLKSREGTIDKPDVVLFADWNIQRIGE